MFYIRLNKKHKITILFFTIIMKSDILLLRLTKAIRFFVDGSLLMY